MSYQLFIGLFFGFFLGFFVLRRTIHKAGYGELKMCRERCPYYRAIELTDSDDEEGNNND